MKNIINLIKCKLFKIERKKKPLNLHLGCGNVILKGFVNIDVRNLKGVDKVADIANLNWLRNNQVDLIYTSHTLEHFSHQKNILILSEWFRVIKPGGKIIIAVPDLDLLIDIYKKTGNSIWNIKSPLMGEQDYPEDTHYSVYNYSYLNQLLRHVGFSIIRRLKDNELITKKDWSYKKIKVPTGEEYKVSLNVIAIK